MRHANQSDFFNVKTRIYFLLFLFFILFCFNACRHQNSKNTMLFTPAGYLTAKMNLPRFLTLAAKALRPRQKIYLTFDDGPNKGTRNVLRTVHEEHVPASFFVVGKHVFDSPEQGETFRQLKADSSVELCNHSYSHAANHYTRFYEHPEAVIKDFQRSEATLSLVNKVARMPGRNAWRIDSVKHTDIKASKAAIDSVFDAGFAVMGWDLEWMFDHKTLDVDKDTDLLLRQIQNMLDASATKTPGHLVLLAHDQAFQKEEDIEKLHYVLQQLKANPGYELVLASQYPGVKVDKKVMSVVNPIKSAKK